MSGTKLKDIAGPEIPTSFILIVPLFHVTGCVPVMMSCFIAGLKLAIMYKWDAEKALEMIEREQITNFVGVPTQSWDLVNSPAFDKYDTSSLRAVGGGGAPSPTSLVGKVNDKVKNGSPQLGYGMTEASPIVTSMDRNLPEPTGPPTPTRNGGSCLVRPGMLCRVGMVISRWRMGSAAEQPGIKLPVLKLGKARPHPAALTH